MRLFERPKPARDKSLKTVRRQPVQSSERSGTVCRVDARTVSRPTARCGCAQSSTVPGPFHSALGLLGRLGAPATSRFRQAYTKLRLTVRIVPGLLPVSKEPFVPPRHWLWLQVPTRLQSRRALRIARTLHRNVG